MGENELEEGLYFDDFHKIRVLEPEAEQQTSELNDECKEFFEKTEDFRILASDVLLLSRRLAEEVEKEKIKAIACRNMVRSFVKERESRREQFQAFIAEKTGHLERLRLQYASLLKLQAEQNEFADRLLYRK